MGKRATLPGASELFRPTDEARLDVPERHVPTQAEGDDDTLMPAASGRVKHDHKITVYFSEDELNALEDANLALRRAHGIRVDRGRLVRTAVALALRDLAARGDESAIVDELRA